MNSRDVSTEAEDQETLAMWIRHGLVHVPLLSMAWPGADPLVIDQPVTVEHYRWHLVMDHCIWHHSSRDLLRLTQEHQLAHDEPLWAHVTQGGVIIHVHGDAAEETEGDEWEW